MCHLILLTLPYSNHKIIIISIILFCDGYHLCFYPVHGQNQNIWLTNYTEDIPLKLIPKDEIIILSVLVEPFFYIDLIIDTENRPFHLKSLDTMIVFNSMHKGHWSDEITLIPNPLIGNTSFMISIVINEDEGFNISFNEQKFFKFEKRKPFDVMKQIHIYGNLILKSVKIIHSSKEENNSMKTLIIGIAITLALLIIVGLIFFYLLRRHCIRSKSKTKKSRKGHDSTIASLGSRRSKKTDNSNVTYLTSSSFLFT